jgi:hypothetical protein
MSITLSDELAERLEKFVNYSSEFDSVEEYVEFIMTENISQIELAEKLEKQDEPLDEFEDMNGEGEEMEEKEKEY